MGAQMSTSKTKRAEALGPAALVLTANVARRFYLDGATKSEIAKELGLSRFQVARILKEAHAAGVVRIEIDYRGDIDLERSVALQRAYGLKHCLVMECPRSEGEALRAQLGAAAAGLLTEIVGPDDVLGVVWARSVMAVRDALHRLAPCTVVQLTGSLSAGDAEDSAVELVRDIARVCTGPAYYFYAPMIVSDADTARSLRNQPEIARTLHRVGTVTIGVVGVGAWRPGASSVADSVGPQKWRELHDLGVRAEVAGIALDADGNPVSTELTDRLIGINAQQLMAVPEVIGIAYDVRKTDAVRAALRGGMLTSLVTESALAGDLLAMT